MAHRQRPSTGTPLESGGPTPAPCEPMVSMEQRRVGNVYSHSGVQDSVQEHLTSYYGSSSVPKDLLGRAQTHRLANSHTGLCCERRTCTLAGTARPGILLSGLSRTQTVRRVAHGHRPTCPKPIYVGGLVQDGVSRLHPTSASSGRMGCVNRFGGRLSSRTYAPTIMEVPKVRPRGRGIRISSSSIRPGSRTVRFHSSDENGVSTLPPCGTSVPRIPGRSSMPGSVAREMSEAGTVNYISYALSRIPDQRKEIGIDPLPGIHISGSVIQSGERHGLSCTSQIGEVPSATRQTDRTNNCVTTGSPQTTRSHGILCSTPAGSKSCQTGVADAVVSKMGLQPMGFAYPSHDVVQTSSRYLATGGISRSMESSSSPLGNANSIHRRLQHRLGGTSQHPTGVGNLVCISQRSSHQLPRDEGGPSGNNGLQGRYEGSGDPPQNGQRHSCRLHQQRGGGSLPRPMQTIVTNTAKGMGSERAPDSQTHSRGSQRFGRLPQSETVNSSDRMDYSPTHDKRDFQSVGKTSHRLVRNQTEQQATDIRVSSTRSTSRERRRSHVRLDGSGRLCFSAAGSPEYSTQEDSVGALSSNSTSPQLASPLVVSTATVSANRDTNKITSEIGSVNPAPISCGTSETGSLPATRLETIQRSLRKKGFSERVSSSISRSRRTSTERIYQSHWSCWVDWAERRQVDPSDPLVHQLCDFLLFLTQEKKFTQGTVKSYRSAICTTIRQSGGPDLSANPILRELVNSLKVNAPKSALRIPQWDIYLVLEALKGEPFEPPTTCDLAHWSYKTAFLLALATAKRRSELHAIEFKTTRWEKNEVHLFLLPEFIAKNQRPGETFPSIVVPAMAHTLRKGDPNRALCPHRALKWYLEKSKALRSSQRRLFISFTKPGKEIAAPTLSRWIVKAVTIAMLQNGQLPCIKNTPRAHEVRAIATSLAIIRSVSMENILRAAFWRNESTFSRFYLRDMSHDMDGKARLPIVAAQHFLPK